MHGDLDDRRGPGCSEDEDEEDEEDIRLSAAPLQSVTTALRNGALRKLQGLSMWSCDMGDGDLRDFMDALELSGVANRLVSLEFINCDFGAEKSQSLADFLSHNTFPALKELQFSCNEGIADAGVMALTGGLLKATQTFLTKLDLSNGRFGDEGMAALASLVNQGRMAQLIVLHIYGNHYMTHRGLIVLARAIDARGMPMLEGLTMYGHRSNEVTVLGPALLFTRPSKAVEISKLCICRVQIRTMLPTVTS